MKGRAKFAAIVIAIIAGMALLCYYVPFIAAALLSLVVMFVFAAIVSMLFIEATKEGEEASDD